MKLWDCKSNESKNEESSTASAKHTKIMSAAKNLNVFVFHELYRLIITCIKHQPSISRDLQVEPVPRKLNEH